MDGDQCISLTSMEDGTLESERVYFSSDVSSSKSGCDLYRSLLIDSTLHIYVEGTGLFMVSICIDNTDLRPVYLFNLRHFSSVDVKLYLNTFTRQVMATFNNGAFNIDVNPKNEIRARITIFDGNFTTTFAQNGKILVKQTCEIAGEENAANTLRKMRSDTPHKTVSDNKGIFQGKDRNKQSKAKRGCKTAYNDVKKIKLSPQPNEYMSASNAEISKENVDEKACDIKTEDKINAYLNQHHYFYYGGNKDFVDELDDDDDGGGINDDDDDNNDAANDDDDDDDDDDNGGGDDNNDEMLHKIDSSETLNKEIKHSSCLQVEIDTFNAVCECPRENEKIELVDIKSNRTELLNIMEPGRLADYFFEAELISEGNMMVIHGLCRKGDYTEANRYLLQELRNRRVQKYQVDAVLIKSEDLHLLDLMFPKH